MRGFAQHNTSARDEDPIPGLSAASTQLCEKRVFRAWPGAGGAGGTVSPSAHLGRPSVTLTIVTATRSLPSALREETLSPYLLFQFGFNDFILSGAILFGTFAMKCPSCWYTEMHFNSDSEFTCVTQLSYNSDVPLGFIAKLTELVFSGSSLLCSVSPAF